MYIHKVGGAGLAERILTKGCVYKAVLQEN